MRNLLIDDDDVFSVRTVAVKGVLNVLHIHQSVCILSSFCRVSTGSRFLASFKGLKRHALYLVCVVAPRQAAGLPSGSGVSTPWYLHQRIYMVKNV